MNPAWSSRAHYLIDSLLKNDQIWDESSLELQSSSFDWFSIEKQSSLRWSLPTHPNHYICKARVMKNARGRGWVLAHIYMHLHTYIYIWRYLISCFDESPPPNICTLTLVLTRFEYMCARRRPTERSEACSERSDEGHDCKLHITQTKDCT